MVEIDSDTYQVKSIENRGTPSPFLLTPGRSQNLDLLQHLLLNTHQVIVLCGPEGAGKTCLLKVLHSRLKEKLRWCEFTGQPRLDFDEVHERVGPLLRHQRGDSSGKHSGQGHGKDVVLVIDEAGMTAPGLITELIRLAKEHAELRLLFVLTHDQWHLKNYSDPAIENCYLVEVRPLLQKECRVFIQHLASFTSSLRFGKGLSDDVIEAVYRESHGIPAKIITFFPDLNKAREGRDALAVLVIAVLGLVSLALFMQWRTNSRPVPEAVAEAAQSRVAASPFVFEQPIVSLPGDNILHFASNFQLADALGTDQSGMAASVNPNAAGEPYIQPGPAVDTALKPETVTEAPASEDTAEMQPEPEIIETDPEIWLVSQPDYDYTLQLMALTKSAVVQSVIGRHPEMQPEMRVIRRMMKGKEKFVLFYGAFTDIDSAKQAKASLPAEFKSALIRKFHAIRKEFPVPANAAAPATTHLPIQHE